MRERLRYSPVPATAALLVSEMSSNVRGVRISLALSEIGVDEGTIHRLASDVVPDPAATLSAAFEEAVSRMDARRLASIRDRFLDKGVAAGTEILRRRLATVGMHAEVVLRLTEVNGRFTGLQGAVAGVHGLYTTGPQPRIDVGIRIAPDITWIVRSDWTEDVHIARPLPMGVVIALVGRPIDTVFRHAISGPVPQTIEKAVVHEGRTLIRLAPADPSLPVPNVRPDAGRRHAARHRSRAAAIL